MALKPLLAHLGSLGAAAKPFATNFAELLTSLRDTGGLERILDFMFLGRRRRQRLRRARALPAHGGRRDHLPDLRDHPRSGVQRQTVLDVRLDVG